MRYQSPLAIKWTFAMVILSAVACSSAENTPNVETASGGSPGVTGTGGAVTSSGGAQQSSGAGGAEAGAGGAPAASGGAPAGGGSESGSGGIASTGGASDSGIIVPVASSPDQRHLLLRDEGNSALHYVDLGDPTKSWHIDIPVGRELQLIGNNQLLIGTENGYEERSVVDGSVTKTVDTFAGTVAALRLRNGNTLLVGADWQGETGVALLEITPAGTEAKRVKFPQFDYVRLVRPTATGTYLVSSDLTIFEGDAAGSVVWQVQVQNSTEPHAWKALRLANGETVVATGYEASLQIFSASEQFLRRLKPSTQTADVNPFFFCDFQILSNGNYLVTNWQDHGTGHGESGRQVIELDPTGALVWAWKQDASYVSSIQAAILLDGLNLGKLHVEDTSGQLVPVD